MPDWPVCTCSWTPKRNTRLPAYRNLGRLRGYFLARLYCPSACQGQVLAIKRRVSFTHQLRDVIKYDNETDGPLPEIDISCKKLVYVLILRLVVALQSDRWRNITLTLWERNVGFDKKSSRRVVFETRSTYSHNEMELGTWKCSWTTYFKNAVYLNLHHVCVKPSEHREERGEQDILYSIHVHPINPVGRPGSPLRKFSVPLIHCTNNY